ncbi:hypothetical protein [Kribbella italica]|uniref:Uncharacterized protein n=1 Tax=Kribbella italica TaxID=1540520 RepID=A0A7W9J128_9ACTN|nr:hypothetical protein [Kribbella italica]MBB5833405.1 hypothetical protein [Kribbella italica]
MSEIPLAIQLAAPFLTGTAVAGVVAAWTARKKVPVERDSIIVNGAETAVVALTAVLAAETARADRAEADRDHAIADRDAERERRMAVELRLDAIQAALDDAREELRSIAN